MRRTSPPRPLHGARRLLLLGLATGLALAAFARPAASADPKQFIAVLNAAQETPPVASTATGNALLTFDEPTKMLCFAIAYSGLSSAETLAHIHGPALPGTPAGIVFPLPAGNPKSGCVGPLTKAQKRDLLKKRYYINIHSASFGTGEIRGQILRVK